ncbi:MAG: hypothetical protein HQM14_04335 [SAR324 cluster bacterium]|nr:hypothetical protein [SAR324 cluster bacterium]
MNQVKLLTFFQIIFLGIPGYFLLFVSESSADTPVLRHVLGIYDSEEKHPKLIPLGEPPEENSSIYGERNPIQDNLAVALNHLGYIVEQLDIHNEPLPNSEQMQRYRLIISWFGKNSEIPQPESFVQWIETQVQAEKKYLMMEYSGMADDSLPGIVQLKKRLYRAIDIDYGNLYYDKKNRIQLVEKDSAMVEFEHRLAYPFPWYDQYTPLSSDVISYLKVKYLLLADSQSSMVMIGKKGGMVAPGYALYKETAPPFRRKWRIDPFRFLKTLLPPISPVPDVTTSEGKRLFYAHIDGDGVRNRSEVNFKKYSSEIILEHILQKYPDVPIGISMIVGDIDPNWWGSQQLIDIARKIYQQPNVEAATHTYTHPFQWQRWDRTSAYAPLGTFRYEREVDESVEWIADHLLPENKAVKLVYWSGDTVPPEEALIRTSELGLDNLNGGDSKFDTAFPSYTSVAPLMRPVGRNWQIFTSASNENLYTKLWTDNFHGFRNVIETFENTESPIRLAAVNVYYHFYIADKIASLASLDRVYQWCFQHNLKMIFPSEYVQLVRGFIAARIVEKQPGVYEISDRGALNTLRLDHGTVDLDKSKGVTGVHRVNQSLYIDLDSQVTTPLIVVLE